MSELNQIGKIYHRPWGTYQTLALGENYQVKIITVKPKGKLSLQKHAKRSEHWVIVKGTPTITVDHETKTYSINARIFIPIDSAHRIENLTDKDTALIEVQIGPYLGEDDIVRLDDIYGRK